MTRIRSVVVTALVSVGVLASPDAAFANSQSTPRDNVVSVENSTDGSLRVGSRGAVAHAPGATVANRNIASAYAHCTDCRTVAAAIQVVIVEGQPTNVQPFNLAVALNENCVRCQTFAYARQVVLSPGIRVRLSDSAENAIDSIDRRTRLVAGSPRPFDQMAAELDNLAISLTNVVRGEIRRAGLSAHEVDRRLVDQDEN